MKAPLKRLARFIAAAGALPAALAVWGGALALGRQQAFATWSQALSVVPGLGGVYLRHGFYWWVLPQCGEDACISFGTILSHPTARIASKVYVGPYGVLGDVTLEDDVLLGSGVSIMNGSRQHGIESLEVPIREQPGEWPHIRIGRDTWIGDRAIVMADVGRHCVIGAGSVVTKPLPDYAIAVGNPARVVRYRKEPHGGSAPWDLMNSLEDGASEVEPDMLLSGDDAEY